MDSLETWAAIAASFLLLQCILANMAFVALSIVMFLASRWFRRRTHGGLQRGGDYFRTVQTYARQVQSRIAAPFVRIHGRIEGMRTTWERLRG